jgi:hypothetical protein
MPASNTFIWIGTASADWITPADWADVTTGQTPAVAAPGSLDIVTIGNATLSGSGDAASVTLLGTDTLLGDVNTGTLVAGAGSTVNINAGATVSAAAATDPGTISVSGSGAAFLVSGTIQLGNSSSAGTLSVGNGGLIQTGDVVLGSADSDLLGPIEIGTAGTDAADALTIDAGYTVSGSGLLNVAEYGQLPPIVDNGLISGDSLTIGWEYPLAGPLHPGNTPVYIYTETVLEGTGTVEVQAGGNVDVQAPVTSPGLLFQLDGSALLTLKGSVLPGTIIDLIGDLNTISLGNPAIESRYQSQPPISVTINGFNTTDLIEFATSPDPVISYANGTLTAAGTTDPGFTLVFAGNYAGDTFVVLPNDEVVLQAGTASTPGPGTSGTDTYTWTGPAIGGFWNTASNWADVTAGQTPAVVAPGSLDVVTIADTILEGSGDAASVTFAGADAELGDLNAGTLTVSNAATLTLNLNASVVAATALDNGTILVLDGFAHFDNLEFGPGTTDVVAVASTGAIAVGTYGADVPGCLTIDTGDTMSGSALVLGTVFDFGLIVGADLTFGQSLDSSPSLPSGAYGGLLQGTGTIEVTSGGTATITDFMQSSDLTIKLDGNASLHIENLTGSGTIDLLGSGDTVTANEDDLALATSSTIIPPTTIVGFTAGDTLDIGLTGFTGDSFAGGPNGGVLTLNGTATFGELTLAGDFTGETFAVAPYATASGPTEGPGVQITLEQTITPCFAAGTRIATPRGGVPIERLRAGDIVTTVSGKPRSIEWIGHRTVDCRRHPFPERVKPIRVAPHAFGENHPKRPLLLSPDHAVFVEAVLIPIKFLVNGTTVEQIDAANITYYHLELARHDVVLAEGLPAESYLETGGRSAFENGGGTVQLHPDFAPDEARVGMVWRNFGYAPLLGTGGEVERVRSRLAVQAVMLGHEAERAVRQGARRRTSR